MPRYICTKQWFVIFSYSNYNNDDVSTIEKTVLQTHFQFVECSSPFYFVLLLLVTTALFLVFLLKSRFTMNYLLIAEPEVYFKFYLTISILYVYFPKYYYIFTKCSSWCDVATCDWPMHPLQLHLSATMLLAHTKCTRVWTNLNSNLQCNFCRVEKCTKWERYIGYDFLKRNYYCFENFQL